MTSVPIGACGPCFSSTPIGRIQVESDSRSAAGQSLAVNSSQRLGRSLAFTKNVVSEKIKNKRYFIGLITAQLMNNGNKTKDHPCHDQYMDEDHYPHGSV